jgi:hypothetical protein
LLTLVCNISRKKDDVDKLCYVILRVRASFLLIESRECGRKRVFVLL